MSVAIHMTMVVITMMAVMNDTRLCTDVFYGMFICHAEVDVTFCVRVCYFPSD